MPYNSNMASSGGDSINTDGIVLYGVDGTLRMNYYNAYVSFRIFPIKPESERTSKSVYDYSQSTSISLSFDDAIYLGWQVENIVIPATLKGEKAMSVIPTVGGKHLLVVSNGIAETGEVNPYIAIFRDLDEKKIPKEHRICRFRSRPLFSEYNPATGEYKASEDRKAGLLIIAEYFKQFKDFGGASLHAKHYLDRYKESIKSSTVEAIANKLGVQASSPINYVGSGSGDWGYDSNDHTTPFGKKYTPEDTTAPTSSTSDLDAIQGLL